MIVAEHRSRPRTGGDASQTQDGKMASSLAPMLEVSVSTAPCV